MKAESQIIAINKSRYYKTPTGNALAAGAFVQALEYATDREATVVGKPSLQFYESARGDIPPTATVMIGDDIFDDVSGSQQAGMRGVLVKTGKYNERIFEASDVKPDHVADTFADAVQFLIA
eukprot:TRINITY_DN10935_c0_g1_i2.p1 TRINITY_DN10935_c0_g1~~TRINITY_DN10935_c0_g1_i2.p1  ORF type:complete len:122 (+),score=27.22 TRINITY_DN10935_c0_g1_i2:383-748(+)